MLENNEPCAKEDTVMTGWGRRYVYTGKYISVELVNAVILCVLGLGKNKCLQREEANTM